jgi:hypothetical protein
LRRVAELQGASNIFLKRYAKGRTAQQFWFDNVSKTIKSQQYKDRSLNIQSNGGGQTLGMTTTNSRWWQIFRLDGAYIKNEKGKVMDVHGGVDAENRNIIVWNRHKGLNQQWDIVYADEYPEEPKKGELNKDFGLYVDRSFYIVSALPDNKFLDIINGR